MPLIRDYPAATSLQSTDAFVIDRTGVGTMSLQGLAIAAPAYVTAFEFLGGTPPLANESMGGHVFPFAVNFPANFAGAYGFCNVNPLASVAVAILKNGAQIGTMSITPGGVFSFATTVTPDFVAGDVLAFVAPAVPDGALANLWWTLTGARP